MSEVKKTHILWNPNKNYLGNWDVDKESDLILTIKSIAWEGVENHNRPIKQGKKIVGYETDEKRVIRFVESYKPMICNEENAVSILNAHGVEYLEDISNLKIAIYTKLGKWFGEERLALRIREKKPQVTVQKKEVLNEKHPKWKGACENLKNGTCKVETICKAYEVSDADKNILTLMQKDD